MREEGEEEEGRGKARIQAQQKLQELRTTQT